MMEVTFMLMIWSSLVELSEKFDSVKGKSVLEM